MISEMIVDLEPLIWFSAILLGAIFGFIGILWLVGTIMGHGKKDRALRIADNPDDPAWDKVAEGVRRDIEGGVK